MRYNGRSGGADANLKAACVRSICGSPVVFRIVNIEGNLGAREKPFISSRRVLSKSLVPRPGRYEPRTLPPKMESPFARNHYALVAGVDIRAAVSFFTGASMRMCSRVPSMY